MGDDMIFCGKRMLAPCWLARLAPCCEEGDIILFRGYREDSTFLSGVPDTVRELVEDTSLFFPQCRLWVSNSLGHMHEASHVFATAQANEVITFQEVKCRRAKPYRSMQFSVGEIARSIVTYKQAKADRQAALQASLAKDIWEMI